MNGSPTIDRVLQVHTRYREPGGEDQVVESERELLEAAGVAVEQVIFDNVELREARSIRGDVALAVSAVWNREAARRVRVAVRAHRPQAVHVHNTFAAASPAVYSAAGMPVVQTLHNYRFICPAATLFRDGVPCTDCVGRVVPLPAVIHRCVRGSLAQSTVAVASAVVHRAAGTFQRGIGCYVALSSFQRSMMVAGGLPSDRIQVVPNFLEPDPGDAGGPRAGVLFVGRLAGYKGVATLLEAAAASEISVRIAGSGPLAGDVERAAADGRAVRLGPIARPQVIDEMRRAVALVVPSKLFEGFPMTVVEAYATGTPVIASRIGSLAEIVDDGVTGLLARPGDAGDLGRAMRWALDHPAEMAQMGAAARARYEALYRGPAHLEALLGLYRHMAAVPLDRNRARHVPAA